MVVRTPPLNSLKRGLGLVPQVHHPLPLNERESQQLLDSITQSFRRNLDEEHPWQQPMQQQYQKIKSQTKTSTATKTNRRATDQHLRSILSNPLFANPETNVANLPHDTVTHHFNVFDSAVAKGLMTLPRATGFLHHLRNSRSQLAATKQGPGRRVLRWLKASGQENELRFLADRRFVGYLVSFMYAEGLQDIAWEWLARLAKLEKTHFPEKPQDHPISILMFAMMKEIKEGPTEANMRSSLDPSYSAWLQANELLSSGNGVALQSVKQAWAYLSWVSTVDAVGRPTPDASLFESYVDLGRRYKREKELAHLDLYHPTSPSHELAVRYLHSRQNIVQDAINDQLRIPSNIPRVVYLATDAAARLKKLGEKEEASFMDGLLTQFVRTLNMNSFKPVEFDRLWIRVLGTRPIDGVAHT